MYPFSQLGQRNRTPNQSFFIIVMIIAPVVLAKNLIINCLQTILSYDNHYQTKERG